MIDNRQLWMLCSQAAKDSGYPHEHFKTCVQSVGNTLPKILLDNRRAGPNTLCMRKKNLGIWHSYTWQEAYDHIEAIALGLKTLGLQPGDKVCIIGDNDPEWYWAEVAVQAMGGVCVGLYIDAMPADIEHIVTNSDSVFAFSKDQEQTDKFLEIKPALGGLKKVIFWDDKGMAGYRSNPWLIHLEELMESGRKYARQYPLAFEQSIENGAESDPAVLSYTSGTTSLPKGVVISHEYLIKGSVRWGISIMPQPDDEYLSFVPPAWIAEQLMVATWLVFRIRINFPEKPETVMENIREIGARSALLGPMQWQGILSQVQMKLLDTGWIRKQIYRVCLAIGYKVRAKPAKNRRRPSFWHRALYGVANALCLYHIRDYLGLSKIRCGITGGSALGPDVIRWFAAIGVPIKDAYGLTELSPATVHRDLIKPGTSGPPLPGIEIKISDAGEIYLRSDIMFDGYYKNDKATAEVIENGWLKTGDCGTLDEDGHLIVYDRMKDMLRIKDGGIYSPTYISNRLKFSPYIKEVLIIGGENRSFLFALITIDFDNVGKWAEKHRLSYTTFVDLSQKQEVYDLIEKDVLRVNATLPANARIQRFTLLHKEFDPDEGELTKTRKLRRAFLEKRYRSLIDAAYGGDEKITITAEVKYRDGRKGTIQTDLNFRTLPVGA